jgi:hypothetical protein
MDLIIWIFLELIGFCSDHEQRQKGHGEGLALPLKLGRAKIPQENGESAMSIAQWAYVYFHSPLLILLSLGFLAQCFPEWDHHTD